MQKIYLALFFAVLSCNVLGQDWLSLFIGSASKYASFSLLSSTSFPLRVSSSEAIYLLSSSTVAVSFPLAEVSERTDVGASSSLPWRKSFWRCKSSISSFFFML